jgi:polysaccharide pyruvyl transferase WcaK-like protein
MKSLYLTGGWGYGNLGDNAILSGMLKTFSERLPDHRINITSKSPEEIFRNHGLPALKSIHGLLRNRNPLAAGRWLAVALWRLSGHRIMLSPALRKHVELMKESSAVVLGGGGYFTDDWMDMLRARYVEIEMAQALGIPIVIYGQTVGPFSDRTLKASLAKFLNKVTFIAHRDVQSKGTLTRSNYPLLSSILSADEANLLAPEIATARTGSSPSKLVVGVMVQKFRRHLGQEGPSPAGAITSEASYIKNFVEALEIVSRGRTGLVFKFIPSTSWDMRVCHEVAKQLSAIVGADKIETFGTVLASEFIFACQNVDIMISTNMHPVILASTSGKPSVAISYHYKLDDYMKSVGLDKYVIRIDDFNAASLSSLVLEVMARYQELAERVSSLQPEVAQMARRNCDSLIYVLSSAKT